MPSLDDLLQSEANRGMEAPYATEIKTARLIIERAPVNCRPCDVATYFIRVAAGDMDDELNEHLADYCSEWPVRANPLIVSFFDATTLRKPAGDQTAWCAAFVNWCIKNSVVGKLDSEQLAGTESAASASFREWGTETAKPEYGDLVVFQHKSSGGKGHVGFYVRHDDTGIYVLGGNQMPLRVSTPGVYERRNTGEVNLKFIPTDGKDLKFHSFRTHPALN